MIFDLITYGLLASVFVINTLRMFVDKPKLQTPQLPWQRLLRPRSKSESEASKF
jgi:hypothetical protein